MQLRTALTISGDSAGAEKALTQVDAAMAGAEAEAKSLQEAYERADKAVDAFARAQTEANEEMARAKTEFAAGAIGAEQYNRQILETKSALSLVAAEHREAMTDLRKSSNAYRDAVNDNEVANDNFSKGSKAAAFAAKNLNFQLMDMAQGLALGMPPMMILMQQVPQAAGAFADLASASGGAGNAVAGLASKFGPLLAIMGAVAAGVGLLTAEVNKNSDVAVTWQDVMLGAFDAAKDFLEGQLKAAFSAFGVDTKDVFGTVLNAAKWAFNGIISGATLVPRTLIAAFQTFPRGFADLIISGVNAGIRALNGLVSKAVDLVNGYVAKVNSVMALVAGAVGGTAFKIPTLTAPQIGEIANSYAGAGAAAGAAMGKVLTDTLNRDWIGEGAKFITPYAEEQARKRGEETGKKAGAAAAKAMGAAGKQAGEDFASEMAKSLNEGLVKAFQAVLGKNSGDLAKLAKDSFDAALRAANDNTDAAQKPIRDAAAATAEWNERLKGTIDYLDQLGVAGGKLGTIGALFAGLRSGDFSGVGGKLGVFAGLFTQTDSGKALVSELRDVLDATFGGSGQFTKKIDEALQGVGLGIAGSQLVFGAAGTNIGAAFGGAIGQAFSKDITKSVTKELGAGLGKIAGAFAPVVGGLLGNLIGGLFKKTKTGTATLGFTTDGIGTISTAGNNGSRISAASNLGNSIGDILANLEDRLGIDIGGQLSTSIGIRKKSFVVDTTGQGRTKGAGTINFGEDQEAAIKAALQDILADATVAGLSEGMLRVLRNGDIEKQAAKVLTVKTVFDAVDQRADPQGFAMAQFEKQFAKVKAILDEGSASAEDYAKAETWAQQQRADIIAEANRAIVEKERDRKELEIAIMAATGDAAGALKAQRDLERQSTEASLIPLKERLWALQDEAEAAAKAQAIADEAYAIETRLLQAKGDTVALQARELASVNEANRAKLAEVFAYEAQKEAAEEAAAKVKAIADERGALEEQLLTVQGNTAELERRRLAALDPSNRALAEQITAEQKLAEQRQQAAADAKAIADERAGLEEQLLELRGDTAEIARRQAEAILPANRALYDQVQAEKALAEQAAKAAAIQQERASLETRYLQVIGDQAALRARELQSVNPENRDALLKVFRAEDAKAAAEALKQQRDAAIAGYKSEAQAMAALAEKMTGFAASIRAFRDETVLGTAAASQAAAQAEFQRVARMASLGDESALGGFNNAGKAYLDAAMRSARSYSEVQDAQAAVAIAANAAIGAAERQAAGARGQADWLSMQTALLEQQGDTLAALNDTSSETLAQLAALNDVQADGVIPAVEDVGGSIDDLASDLRALIAETKALREEAKADRAAAKSLLQEMASVLRGTSRNGYFNVGNDGGAPAIPATIVNTADAPALVDQVP